MLVTHHVEEIPPGFTDVLLLRDGRVVAAGPLEITLTAENLSATFGLPLVARAARPTAGAPAPPNPSPADADTQHTRHAAELG